VSLDTPNVLKVMIQFEQVKVLVKTTKKVALKTEKEKDVAFKEVEKVKRQLEPKRARTDDDAGDAHDLLVEFDNCGLRDHRREGMVEDTDPTPVDQISWCKFVLTPSRPFGQKTNLLLHHHHQCVLSLVPTARIVIRDVRVGEIVEREVEKTKPDKWGCV
jgi:hypothetical protein